MIQLFLVFSSCIPSQLGLACALLDETNTFPKFFVILGLCNLKIPRYIVDFTLFTPKFKESRVKELRTSTERTNTFWLIFLDLEKAFQFVSCYYWTWRTKDMWKPGIHEKYVSFPSKDNNPSFIVFPFGNYDVRKGFPRRQCMSTLTVRQSSVICVFGKWRRD